MAVRRIELDPRTKKIMIAVGAAEAVFKIIALVDLARRRQAAVRGKKIVWATAITTINSAGLVPLLYFLIGRR
ncbi:PLDc N-terminal domain-containing protein [Microlunatus sp. Gsoil 973]|jgi:hypothetical protein|uniref:PLDc N-terminal domain-containing protein n=1 Tax=Microlunatus sp. Gsoil 973 TaxID=2672569 RepID=UPI0012B47B46|nr:PLDc N-terminal domain-containing protein [Microlunatus sp. Gsoil 973]QGN33441.1 hypothetical protein GJV80_12160 [Microlunatus sp. Gsoil 973]